MEYREAYEKALQLLNVRFLSERELRDKLRRRGAADAVLDEVVAALKEEHFLDDQRLAGDVYRYYARKGQYGHLYIANRLRRRGLPVPEDVERLMSTPWLRPWQGGNFPIVPMKPARQLAFCSTAAFRRLS